MITVYFTSYPYNLYYQANKYSNFGLLGISSSLIVCKNMFWISNTLVCIILYFKDNKYFYKINMFLLLICIYLYIHSFLKFIYNEKYIRNIII